MLPNKSEKLKVKSQNQKERLKSFKVLFFISCSVLFAFAFLLSCLAEDKFIYDSQGGQNPFIPWVTNEGVMRQLKKKEKADALAIDGIMYDKSGASYALINGQVVGVGDNVNGYQVLKIEQNRVFFSKDGQFVEMELKKEVE